MKAWIFYHRGCTDGAAAAYAAWLKYGKDACYTPINFGQSMIALARAELYENEQIDVFFLDVTPDPTDIGKLVEAGHRVTIIDHHKTYFDFIEKLDGPTVKSISRRYCSYNSGSKLAWEVFHGEDIYPDIIVYTNDYDTYRFEYGEVTHAYQVAFELQDLDNIQSIAAFAERPVADVLKDGLPMLKAKLAYTSAIASKAFPVLLDGHVTLFCYAPRTFRNDVADNLLKDADKDTIVATCDVVDQNIYQISLRARKGSDIDLTTIAKQYKGGGHGSSAGFVVEDLSMFVGIGRKPEGFFKRLFKRLFG